MLVAQARAPSDALRRLRHVLGTQPCGRLSIELGEGARDTLEVERARRLQARPRKLRLEVRDEQAESRKHARRRGYQDRADAQQPRERSGMEGTGTAECEQREVAWIIAALHGDHPDGAYHVIIGNRQNAPRRILDAQAERLGDYRADPVARGGGVEREAAADQVRRQMPQHEVGVCNRRLVAAALVAERPGLGAGLCGPTRSVPPSTCASEPPPAPMVMTSTIGNPSGQS